MPSCCSSLGALKRDSKVERGERQWPFLEISTIPRKQQQQQNTVSGEISSFRLFEEKKTPGKIVVKQIFNCPFTHSIQEV